MLVQASQEGPKSTLPRFLFYSLSFVWLYLSVLCKLRARGSVRVGVSLNLVTGSGVHGKGPTLVMSTPAQLKLGPQTSLGPVWRVFAIMGVILSSHGAELELELIQPHMTQSQCCG